MLLKYLQLEVIRAVKYKGNVLFWLGFEGNIRQKKSGVYCKPTQPSLKLPTCVWSYFPQKLVIGIKSTKSTKFAEAVFCLIGVSHWWEVLEDGERCECWHESYLTGVDSMFLCCSLDPSSGRYWKCSSIYHAKYSFCMIQRGGRRGEGSPPFFFFFLYFPFSFFFFFKYIKVLSS